MLNHQIVWKAEVCIGIFLKAKEKIALILSLTSWLMDFCITIFESLFHCYKRSMEYFTGGKNAIFKCKKLFFWVDVTLKDSKTIKKIIASLPWSYFINIYLCESTKRYRITNTVGDSLRLWLLPPSQNNFSLTNKACYSFLMSAWSNFPSGLYHM